MIRRSLLIALLLGVSSLGAQAPAGRYTTWRDYGGAADSMQYSALRQIDKRNVMQLEPAWFFPVPDRTGNFGFNPIVIDGVMYVLGPRNSVAAIDAATGKQVWRTRPRSVAFCWLTSAMTASTTWKTTWR